MAKSQQPERENLTKKVIDKLQLPDEKPSFIWDKELPGFGVKLNPTGIVYIVQSRVNGKVRRVSIGKHGAFTPDKARKRAKELLQDMAHGRDPTSEKRQKKASLTTLREVAKDYKKNKKTRAGHPLKDSSKADIDKHVSKTFSEWADKPIGAITREKVITKYRDAARKSTAQANQAFRILRALYNWARATTKQKDGAPLLPENPVQALNDLGQWGYVPSRKSRIPTSQIGQAWNVIQKLRADPALSEVGRMKADYVAFLLLTGCRTSEAATLTWAQVDLEKSIWTLPDPKNRNPVTFPLSSQAKEILDARPKNDRFVFANETMARLVIDCRPTLAKLSKEINEKITPHDLRRTFRSVAGECGIELWKTKLLMNHKLTHDVTISAYTETSDLRYLQPEAQKIASWVERKAKIAVSEKVVDINYDIRIA